MKTTVLLATLLLGFFHLLPIAFGQESCGA